MRHLAAATAFILLSIAVVPAHANTLNISGTFSGIATLSGSPPIITESFTGTGTEATFGPFTGQEQATVDISGLPSLSLSSGTFSWTFATGFMSGTFSGSGPFNALTINFLITGGLLAGNSGSGTATETFSIIDSTTATVSGQFTGVITAPGDVAVGIANFPTSATPLPSTWLMLLGGFVGLGFFAYRGTKKHLAIAAA